MRIHYPNALKIVETLNNILYHRKYADKAIEQTLRSDKKLGSKDRSFIAETCYEIVRYFRYYDTACNHSTNYWMHLAAFFLHKKLEFPEWPEFKHVKKEEIQSNLLALESQFKIVHSYPDWMDELCGNELGESNWHREALALNQTAQVVLRCNTLKANLHTLQASLVKTGYACTSNPKYPDALFLEKRQPIFSSDLFKQGFFELQDASSQCVAAYLEVEPGMRVIDACAGGGGKTLHICALMQNKGKIIAMDTEAWKLDELKKRARRGDCNIIESRHIDSTKVIKRLKECADRILLDVPCSGIGVLKRNPDAKWKLDITYLDEVRQKQQQILDLYSSMLKPNGKLVYATCSILPSENQKQVEIFLKNHPDFSLEAEQTLLPSETGFDGFYMARLLKNK